MDRQTEGNSPVFRPRDRRRCETAFLMKAAREAGYNYRCCPPEEQSIGACVLCEDEHLQDLLMEEERMEAVQRRKRRRDLQLRRLLN
ncbi:hypothetical protein ACLKA6_007223 [Drosophila palustris]